MNFASKVVLYTLTVDGTSDLNNKAEGNPELKPLIAHRVQSLNTQRFQPTHASFYILDAIMASNPAGIFLEFRSAHFKVDK